MKESTRAAIMLFIVFFWVFGYSTLVLVGKTLGVGE